MIVQTIRGFWCCYGPDNMFDKTFADADVANNVKNLNFFLSLSWMIFSNIGAAAFWSVPDLWRFDSFLSEAEECLDRIIKLMRASDMQKKNEKMKMIDMEKETA